MRRLHIYASCWCSIQTHALPIFLLTLSFLSSPIGFPTAPVPSPARLSPRHDIIREHHLPRCFFSDVFRQWIHHDGKQERAESGYLVEANFHCKGFACSCSTPSLQFRIDSPVWSRPLLLWHFLVSHASTQFSLGTVSCFSRPMNTPCKY